MWPAPGLVTTREVAQARSAAVGPGAVLSGAGGGRCRVCGWGWETYQTLLHAPSLGPKPYDCLFLELKS